jgi:hypothetical protein
MAAEDQDFRKKRSSSGCLNDREVPEAPYLDELATGLAEGSISRRQALKWAGFGVLGAALSSLGFADTAEAISRRKCRRRFGGTPLDRPLERGQCDCGFNCPGDDPPCGNDPECVCLQQPNGRGFCGRHSDCRPRCTTSADCPEGSRCAINTCCDEPICLPECSSSAPAAASTEGGGRTSSGR